MTEMPTLFDETLAVRSTDPDTSRDAAISILPVRNLWMGFCLRALVELETGGGVGATVHEIAMRLAYSGKRVPAENSLARRLTDLRERDLIEDVGVRRPGGTGRMQVAWCSTETGRAQL